MSQQKTDLIAAMLERSRRMTLDTAHAVPESARLLQLREGKATPLWLLGHMANTINTVILRWLLDEPSQLSPEEVKLFAPGVAGGAPPSTDPSLYPSWDAVVSRYEEVMERAIKGVRGMHDDDLPKPLPDAASDRFRQRFPTIGDALQQMVHHDAYHCGQLGMLAKLGA
jgi:hypothetical protein